MFGARRATGNACDRRLTGENHRHDVHEHVRTLILHVLLVTRERVRGEAVDDALAELRFDVDLLTIDRRVGRDVVAVLVDKEIRPLATRLEQRQVQRDEKGGVGVPVGRNAIEKQRARVFDVVRNSLEIIDGGLPRGIRGKPKGWGLRNG